MNKMKLKTGVFDRQCVFFLSHQLVLKICNQNAVGSLKMKKTNIYCTLYLTDRKSLSLFFKKIR